MVSSMSLTSEVADRAVLERLQIAAQVVALGHRRVAPRVEHLGHEGVALVQQEGARCARSAPRRAARQLQRWPEPTSQFAGMRNTMRALLADAAGRHQVVVGCRCRAPRRGSSNRPVALADHLPAARAGRRCVDQQDRAGLAQHAVLAVLAVDPRGVEGLGVVEAPRTRRTRRAWARGRRTPASRSPRVGPARPRARIDSGAAQGRGREQGDHDAVPVQLVDHVAGHLGDGDLVGCQLLGPRRRTS